MEPKYCRAFLGYNPVDRFNRPVVATGSSGLCGLLLLIVLAAFPNTSRSEDESNSSPELVVQWAELEQLPDNSDPTGDVPNLGVAGPFVGVQTREDRSVLVVAGGANFPIREGHQLWDKETSKKYHDQVWVLSRTHANQDEWEYNWRPTNVRLPSPRAYGVSVSTSWGIFCAGGMSQTFGASGSETDATAYSDAYLLRWNFPEQELERIDLPPLPESSVNGGAGLIGSTVYVLTGQSDVALDSATRNLYALDLSSLSTVHDQSRDHGKSLTMSSLRWQRIMSLPEGERAYAAVTTQHNGYHSCLYVIGGRRVSRADDSNPVPTSPGAVGGWHVYGDVWEFCPARYSASSYDATSDSYINADDIVSPWRRRADIHDGTKPLTLMAGSAIHYGPSHVLLVSGSTGDVVRDAFADKKVPWSEYDSHPGFHRGILAFHTVTDTWTKIGEAPTMDDPFGGPSHQVSVNAVTSPVVRWGEQLLLASGEIRPKVRSPKIWSIQLESAPPKFGTLNLIVLVAYLLAMVGVGVFFARRNKTTDDYFRGGQRIPWWAAACSIYATMLSSLTYTGLPAKVFAQDWVLFLSMFMILATAPIAIFLALPFYRRIDATSAYEYLERRFSRGVRLFGSTVFTLFHISRMGIVMALTALALAAVTPLSSAQCVLAIGVLCVVYCSIGGIEAVIWTDTIQTFVLLGGALLCLYFLITGAGGLDTYLEVGQQYSKFDAVIWNFGSNSYTQLAIWVIILGGLGQNISSYTADQAVVQRYLTTPDTKLAAKSILMNGFMAVPGSAIFFAIGTGLFVYYHQHPAELPPTLAKTDQIFPNFIVSKLPAGIAGVIIAGIFAAAQSTVSTSMNSTATTVVTDFLRPFKMCKSEESYLRAAKWLTLALGVCGTCAGLAFLRDDIRLLFDMYIKVIGMLMGALAGLFALGILTRRGNSTGAMLGLAAGLAVTIFVWAFTKADGFLYSALSIASCSSFGYLASLMIPGAKSIAGLTVFTLSNEAESAP